MTQSFCPEYDGARHGLLAIRKQKPVWSPKILDPRECNLGRILQFKQSPEIEDAQESKIRLHNKVVNLAVDSISKLDGWDMWHDEELEIWSYELIKLLH